MYAINKERRYGKFFVPRELLMSCPDQVQKLLSTVIILKADYSFCADGIEYWAWGEMFDEVPNGSEAPTYGVNRRIEKLGLRMDTVILGFERYT